MDEKPWKHWRSTWYHEPSGKKEKCDNFVVFYSKVLLLIWRERWLSQFFYEGVSQLLFSPVLLARSINFFRLWIQCLFVMLFVVTNVITGRQYLCSKKSWQPLPCSTLTFLNLKTYIIKCQGEVKKNFGHLLLPSSQSSKISKTTHRIWTA